MLRRLAAKSLSGYLLLSKENSVFNVVSLGRSYPVCFQAANISSKAFRDRSYKKPAPFPYKEKKFLTLYEWLRLDVTTSRFDENTQLLVVDGNIGVGKSTFAKYIAEEFEMLHMPEVSVDEVYVIDNGFDLRTLNPLLPANCQLIDVRSFYENPFQRNVAMFQVHMYVLRLQQYMEALAHILNTGQGVVLERSPYSDFVFMEAMCKAGYLSKRFKSYYEEVKEKSLRGILLRPTVILYLDCPVDILMDRIAKRNINYEVNSKVLTKEYLTNIEQAYKQTFLKEQSVHSEMLIYDWSEFGDLDAVVDDIERLDFDKYDKFDVKLYEWRMAIDEDMLEHRLLFTNNRKKIIDECQVYSLDVPEMIFTVQDGIAMTELGNQIANTKYRAGFNPHLGDKNFLFKSMRENNWESQKLIVPFYHYND